MAKSTIKARQKAHLHPYALNHSPSNSSKNKVVSSQKPIFAQSESDLPSYLSKYFAQRYSLFSLYDFGIQLDHGTYLIF